MYLNFFVILFLIAMAILWGIQGGFSAALHLLMVIIAGTLALAFWEPLAVTLLTLPESVAGTVRPFAWGLALLLPFLLFLLLLRIAADKLIKGNVHLQGTISQLVGGACGVASGILAAGLTIIALGFLGGPASLAGYQPYIVASDSGQIIPNPEGGDLWIDVDEWAGDFFSRLSLSGFAGRSASLATHRPNLAREAAVFHLRYHDPHASVVVGPGGVSIQGVYTLPTSKRTQLADLPGPILDTLGDDLNRNNHRIIVIETRWRQFGGAYDSDGTLRVAPTQVRLLTHSEAEDEPAAEFHSPIGFGKLVNPNTGDREFYSTRTGRVYASSVLQEQPLAWLFVLPETRELDSVLLRQLRFSIENTNESAERIMALLGDPVATEEEPDQGERPQSADGQGMPDFLERTDRLPQPVSRNAVTNLNYTGEDQKFVASGRDDATGRGGGGTVDSQGIMADRVYAGSGDSHVIIRARMEARLARSLLGRARQAAQNVASGLWLQDDFKQTWEPIGYVWDKSGPMELYFRPDQPFRSPSELPVAQMGDTHTLYLYFRVPRDRTIIGYKIGTESAQDLNISVTE